MTSLVLQTLYAFITTVGFSIMFNVKRKHLVMCGLVGAIGWATYWFLTYSDFSEILATFLASVIVAEFSYFLSKYRLAPITVFLIPGIIPLVPGIALYRTMYFLLFMSYAEALSYALLTFQLAGVIVGGIMISSLLPALIISKRTCKKE